GLRDVDRALARGLTYLLEAQNEAGGFVTTKGESGPVAQGVLYADGIASLTVVEAFALTRERRYALPMRHALSRLVKAQNEEGWWPYVRNGEKDIVASVWAAHALQTAQRFGWGSALGVNTALDRFDTWLDGVSTFVVSRAADSRQTGSRAFASGAAAVVAVRKAREIASTGDLAQMSVLLRDYYTPSFAPARGIGAQKLPNVNFLAWYFGSLAAHQEQAPPTSNEFLNRLFGTLVSDGKANFAEFNIDGTELEREQGFVYCDALAALAIENAYRLRTRTLRRD
ncbi:MAG: hypothetical protein KDB07_04900, partial [Planctomycetes bacterium]|nr:hypothetical protein [Planctomycetota bacterium]